MLDTMSVGREDERPIMPEDDHNRGGRGGKPAEKASDLVNMMIAQALTNQKVEEVGRLVNELRAEVRELKSTFATKAELTHVADEVKSLKDWNQWVLRAIVGLVVAAIVGGVLLKGGTTIK